MNIWALGAVAMTFSVVGVMACGAAGSTGGTTTTGVGGSTGVTVSTSHAATTTTTSGAGGAGGAGSGAGGMDAVCTNPSALTQACLDCVFALAPSTACIQSFVQQCDGNAACTGYLDCQNACASGMPDAGGAGGGGAGCLAGDANGDAGSAQANCVSCCQNGNPAGTNDFFGEIITSCACTAAAPCAADCM